MKVTKYAQSTILIEERGTALLIDPGKYNFENRGISRDFFRHINLLFITHRHEDHYDLEAVKTIYLQSKPKIYTVSEVSSSLKKEGIDSVIFKVGNTIEEGPFSIKAIHTYHKVKGELIDCFGLFVRSGNQSLYHTSDTLYLKEKPNNVGVLFVPINNRDVCMSIDEAVRFTREVKPKIVIPIHYDSPKDTTINPRDFLSKITSYNIESKIMNFGDSIDVSKHVFSGRTE